jgi:hypothetical protein
VLILLLGCIRLLYFQLLFLFFLRLPSIPIFSAIKSRDTSETHISNNQFNSIPPISHTMFDAIKNWFSPAQENENKWDARNVELQQPNSPAGPAMNNEAVNQQPV